MLLQGGLPVSTGKSIVVGLWGLVAVAAAWGGDAGDRTPVKTAATIDALVEAARHDHGFPGVSVAVTHGGELVMARGYGVAVRESGTPASAESVYGIGSISKSFTAAFVMKLVEEGKIDLEDPISRFLPESPESWSAIRVRHLLQHASGIPDFLGLPGFEEMEKGTPEQFSRDDLVALFREAPLLFQPGERWAYSNSNYTLLGLIIEAVSGRLLEEALDQQLLGPAGLAATYPCGSRPVSERVARGYEVRADVVAVAPVMNPNTAVGDGGLCSSVLDLVRWMETLTSGRLVSAESFRRMTTADRLVDGTRLDYGFGFSVGDFEGRRRVGHSGHGLGFTGSLAFYPEEELIVAVLTNDGNGWPEVIEKRIARALLGIPEPGVAELPLDASGLQRYLGTYDTGNFPLQVLEEAGRLRIDIKGPIALRHEGSHSFASASDPDAVRLTFSMGASRADGVVLEFAGMRWYGVRRVEVKGEVIMSSSRSPERVDVEGTELHYYAQGSGPPVVLVHGSLADYTYWEEAAQVTPLAEHYRVIAYSRRYNHPNRNEPGDAHSPMVEARDLRVLLDELGTGPVHLVGHSYGAYTALIFALEHPDLVRSLVLAEPPILPWLPDIDGGEGIEEGFMAEVWEPLGDAFREGGDDVGLDFTAQWYFQVPFAGVEPRWQTLFRNNVREWRALAMSRETYPAVDYERVRALAVPTLLLSGGRNSGGFNDLIDGQLERLLPDVRRVVIPEASHEMFLDFPEVTARTMLDFFRSASGSLRE
jgi:CubicO group peptidase (beta-lactamase class C family)/pimeloyl-ACP methyl ester carboxylesterase